MTEMKKSMALFSGSVNPKFAEEIADKLGVPLGNIKLEKFSNGEIYARYLQSVRGADVFIIQSIAGTQVNDALMEDDGIRYSTYTVVRMAMKGE